MIRAAGTALLGVALAGCGAGSLGNFTDGATLERCDDTFPVCETTAGCVLGEGRYIEGRFPGQRQVIVSAPAGGVISVQIFFLDQTAAGVDTEIRWHEPGCFDTYRWSSEGQDIFILAGDSRVLEESQQVVESGDHLVEVFSDAVLDYLMKVEVTAEE